MDQETIITIVCAFGGSVVTALMSIGYYKHKIDNHDECIKKQGEDLEGGLKSVRQDIEALEDEVDGVKSDSRLLRSALDHNTQAIEKMTKVSARLVRGFIRMETLQKERDRGRASPPSSGTTP